MSTTFSQADGWNVVRATVVVGKEDSPVAWAANVPFQPESVQHGFPDNTVKQLQSGGIVISILGPRPFTGEADFPQLSEEPLAVIPDHCSARDYGSQPQPHIAVCPIDRWVGGDKVLNAMVWFGSAAPGEQPSQALIDSANEELARLEVD